MVDVLHRMKIMERNINIVNDLDGRRFVLINDIRWKGKREDWNKYLYDFLSIKKETSSPLES